jgi:hypothetical protein
MLINEEVYTNPRSLIELEVSYISGSMVSTPPLSVYSTGVASYP